MECAESRATGFGGAGFRACVTTLESLWVVALARISHGTRCGLGTPISRLAICGTPIGRLAFPGFKACSACQVCVAIGRRLQSNHPEWTAFPGVGPAPSW